MAYGSLYYLQIYLHLQAQCQQYLLFCSSCQPRIIIVVVLQSWHAHFYMCALHAISSSLILNLNITSSERALPRNHLLREAFSKNSHYWVTSCSHSILAIGSHPTRCFETEGLLIGLFTPSSKFIKGLCPLRHIPGNQSTEINMHTMND